MDGFFTGLGGLRAVGHRSAARRDRSGRDYANYVNRSRKLRLEPLEDRAMLSVGLMIGPAVPTNTGTATTVSTVLQKTLFPVAVPPAHTTVVVAPAQTGHGNAPTYTTGSMTPAQIRTAYGLNPSITVPSGTGSGTITGDGTGQTIAIVDAYKDSTIASDLATFDSTFGLPDPPSLLTLNENGGTDLSGVSEATTSGNWVYEIPLDVEWAHAIAPNANIVLFEANSSGSDLYTAVNTARQYTNAQTPNVSVVSMSWGGSENYFVELLYDGYFKTYSSSHCGVTFVTSTGDSGAPGEYPADSPTVLAVGGTTLDIRTRAAPTTPSRDGLAAAAAQAAMSRSLATRMRSIRGPIARFRTCRSTLIRTRASRFTTTGVGGTSAAPVSPRPAGPA